MQVDAPPQLLHLLSYLSAPLLSPPPETQECQGVGTKARVVLEHSAPRVNVTLLLWFRLGVLGRLIPAKTKDDMSV